MTSLSEITIDLKSDWSIAKKTRKARRQATTKSITSSKKILDRKHKIQSKVSILIKSGDPYFITDNEKTV
jgi:hypothetical protein